MKKTNSARLFKEASKMFPGGVHSPVRAFKAVNGPPIFMKKGNGCRIIDVDDNEYIDFCGSWGPLILGHNHSAIRKTLKKNLDNGTSFGAPTQLGNEIGRLLLSNNRFIDKIRFVSSGTEAVMSAIRLARGYTGKNKIVKFEGCYHGHVDSLLVKAGSGLVTLGVSTSAGIPESFVKETIVLPLNDLEACENLLKTNDDIAAIIIEPIPANNGLLIQDKSFLLGLRELTKKYNSLLIFDEVISGFRVGFEGASGYYDIQADIITYGKIIGGGLPVGAFGASHAIMDYVAPVGNVYQAGTLSANPLAISAGIASLTELLKPGFYESLEEKTSFFVNIISEHIKKKKYDMSVQSIASIFWFSFSKKRTISATDINVKKMIPFREMHGLLLKKGIYLGPSGYEVGFISAAHDFETLAHSASVINKVIDKVMKK